MNLSGFFRPLLCPTHTQSNIVNTHTRTRERIRLKGVAWVREANVLGALRGELKGSACAGWALQVGHMHT